jgi:hypothetical protein
MALFDVTANFDYFIPLTSHGLRLDPHIGFVWTITRASSLRFNSGPRPHWTFLSVRLQVNKGGAEVAKHEVGTFSCLVSGSITFGGKCFCKTNL